jgi:hypothetical protein
MSGATSPLLCQAQQAGVGLSCAFMAMPQTASRDRRSNQQGRVGVGHGVPGLLPRRKAVRCRIREAGLTGGGKPLLPVGEPNRYPSGKHWRASPEATPDQGQPTSSARVRPIRQR